MSDHTKIPSKVIISNAHLNAFIKSETHHQLINFINQLNDSVIGLPLDHPVKISPNIESTLVLLENIKSIAIAHPPLDNKLSRFGNPAFRDFYDQIVKQAKDLQSWILIPSTSTLEEISAYLIESWGNRTRIDYGSGMELNFLCWMLCLRKLEVFSDDDYPALVIKVFWKYIEVMRYLQSTYWLEPAGSHGVWGLDDYHFLPFLFGSSQLRNHKYLRPKSIHDPDVLEGFSRQYMYLACIQFINSIKTASLRWHSPMLDDISGVKTWEKVNSGMIKMYKAEVLGKLPVAQHFLFGTLLPFPHVDVSLEPDQEEELVTDKAGHVHIKGQHGWGECCGIPIPSSFAAAAATQDTNRKPILNGSTIKRIPFD
ncbi:hypothetical protein CROQUDRAFT_57809 [Cronartium quercuum f. sp. fusiforme G11]|uniref:Serine/threonine-protein phosphatase 2A activator n=1 Tax=Cronartium quercuum f. sp. fusiforme G11 TaxID=708437 RepID=A0A9P6NV60_9BASI|nr:hypothetical protein CROQUDRAFT_57809 [Cronartium quercuum f. sp. fusiforme G11]